jgi:type I restriction enzyme S subunit
LPWRCHGVCHRFANGAYPFFTCAQNASRIDGYVFDTEAVIVAGNGEFNVKYYNGKFDAYQRTYVIESKEGTLPKFLYYEIQHALPEITADARGSTIKYLKIGDFSDFIFELPTLAEQEKIAEVLSTVDEEIRKTDEVILATEKLKGGLMQELFTKGIGHTKFKETKIGQIPEEWNASLMAEKIDFQEGPGILAKDFHESGVPLIRLEGINSDSLLNGCNYLDRDLVVKKWSHFKLQKGDILLSSSASLGRVAVVEDEGVGAIAYTGIVRFRSQDTSVSNNFIQCFLTSPIFQEQIGSHDTGSTIKHFGPSHLKKMWFVVPSIKEQKKITEILSATNEKISVNKKLKEKLTLLKKGLMQDLLSGKVRTKEYEL